MARRRKRSKRRNEGGLSDGVKQSIFAVAIVVTGVLFLLSFFGAGGTVGAFFDGILTSLFGWDRWLFAIVLLALGWSAIFPDRRLLSNVNLIGILVFFLSFNGLLNLLLAKEGLIEDVERAGGYAGLLISAPLVGLIGFWGAFVVALAGIFVAIFLTFNVSLHSILTVHTHFTNLGRILHREGAEEDDEEYDEDDEEYEEEEGDEEAEDDEEYEEEVDDEEDEDKEAVAAVPVAVGAGESVMTSRRRRKIGIPINLLDDRKFEAKAGDTDRASEIIQKTFKHFKIDVEMVDIRVGPAVTQYSLKPAQGVKLSKIIGLQNDLALALAAHPIRIEAPIPGKALVGIEVPNQKVGSVSLRELLESKEFKNRKSNMSAPLGKDVSGAVSSLLVDKAPHTLVAGATGSGKSVCLNVIIVSLLYQNGPDDLKIIMVDPKRVELGVYAGIPHLLVPPITKSEEAINALKWGVREMERRLDHLAKHGARDIDAYNAKSKERMPKIVFIIDELADLMSQNKRDVESLIVRIAQMSRAAGIHLILATQRPSVDVITGIIKANIPTRLAFAVASQVDSKTILDISGAEKLLGRGDMLMSTPQLSKPKRLQGAFVSDEEIKRVVKFLKKEGDPDYNYQVTEDTRGGGIAMKASDSDPLLEEAINIVINDKKASTSYLQRRMRIGYSRAARIVDLLEEMGIIGPQNGSKPRDVLIDEWPPAGTAPEPEDDEELETEEIDESVDKDEKLEEDEDDMAIEEEDFDDEEKQEADDADSEEFSEESDEDEDSDDEELEDQESNDEDSEDDEELDESEDEENDDEESDEEESDDVEDDDQDLDDEPRASAAANKRASAAAQDPYGLDSFNQDE